MKTFISDVKITFAGNELEAENIEQYKELVIESFEEEFPSIHITKDEIHNIEEIGEESEYE